MKNNCLITISVSDKRKSNEKIPFECQKCKKTFKRNWNHVKWVLKHYPECGYFNSCSRNCQYESMKTGKIFNCKHCGKEVYRSKHDFNEKNNHFCSQSCACSYNNTHKSTGYRRSKLEIWIENKLTLLYPNLEIHFNKKEAISSELDIYIPSLKLAFELNGIFHYEPIFGQDKLNKIQNNDGRKFQACLERGIELCIIDTSNQTYFKEKTSQKYLDIISNIINQKYQRDC